MIQSKSHIFLLLLIPLLSINLTGCVQDEQEVSETGPTILYDSFNENTCQHTNRTVFTLSKESNITDIILWYHWSKNETEVPFTILKDDTTLIKDVLLRDSCDPTESAWCNALAVLNQTFPAGTFELVVQTRQLGMNSESDFLGFIRVHGTQT